MIKNDTSEVCKGCGNRFSLGYRITKSGGTRVATVASQNYDRGVTCRSCANKKLAPLADKDKVIREKNSKQWQDATFHDRRGER